MSGNEINPKFTARRTTTLRINNQERTMDEITEEKDEIFTKEEDPTKTAGGETMGGGGVNRDACTLPTSSKWERWMGRPLC